MAYQKWSTKIRSAKYGLLHAVLIQKVHWLPRDPKVTLGRKPNFRVLLEIKKSGSLQDSNPGHFDQLLNLFNQYHCAA